MKYLALIYAAADAGPKPGTPEHGQMMAEYMEITQTWAGSGMSLASEALAGVETATSIRIRDGKMQTMDGPFAETKEHLGGFYLLECKDLDEAIAEAAKIPTVKYGTIEVRPIFDWAAAMAERAG